MSSEEEYNKLMRDKLDSRGFEVSDNKWENALRLIEEQENLPAGKAGKKKRRFFFFLIPTFILILTGILIVTLTNTNQNENKKEITEFTTKNELTDKTPKEEIKNNGTENTPSAIEKEIETITTSKKENFESKSATEKIRSSATEKIKENKYAKSQNKISLEKSKNNQQLNTMITSTLTAQSAGNVEVALSKNSKKNNTSKAISQEEKPIATNQKSENLQIEKNNAANLKELNNDVTENKTSVLVEPKKDSVISIKETSIKDSVIAETKTQTILPTATLTPEQKKDSVPENKSVFEIHSFVGAAYTPGYGTNPSILKGINPLAGIFIVKNFKNNLGFSLGCNYMSFGNTDNNPKIYTSTFQDFGYRNQITEIYTNRLHYFNFPVMFNYRRSKNDFGIGAQFSYMFGASSNVKIYDEAYGIKTDKESFNSYGYVNGIKPYDLLAVLAYRRNLIRNIGFGVSANYGLIDVKDNTFFNSDAFERNSSIQFFLTYKLYK